jgi:hypothetical protein
MANQSGDQHKMISYAFEWKHIAVLVMKASCE